MKPFWTPLPPPFPALLSGRTLPALVALCLLIQGCAALREPAPTPVFETDAVRRDYGRLRSANPELASLRGVGAVAVRVPGRAAVDARVRFVLAPPDRIRMGVHAVTGLPLLTLAADGRRLYLVEHRGHRFFDKRMGGDTLADLVGAPVRMEELTAMLAGRLPDMALRQAAADGDGGMVLLTEPKGMAGYRVGFGAGPDGPLTRLERLDADGSVAWRADLSPYRQVGAYRLPARIRLDGADGAALELRIERHVADQPVDGVPFFLEPPP